LQDYPFSLKDSYSFKTNIRSSLKKFYKNDFATRPFKSGLNVVGGGFKEQYVAKEHIVKLSISV